MRYDNVIDSYNIIRLTGNALSEKHAETCRQSCLDEGDVDPEKIFFSDAVNGFGDKIKFPFSTEKEVMERIAGVRFSDTILSRTEISCYFSHYFLWRKCMEVERPIVIFEHDARMLRPFPLFPFANCIMYLGNESHESFEGRLDQYIKGPIRRCKNKTFIDRSHAYAIDPFMAKQLVMKTLRTGIVDAVDATMTFDDFCIIQPVPMIATVDSDSSTINHSGKSGIVEGIADDRKGTVEHTQDASKTEFAFWSNNGLHTGIV